MCCLCGGKTLNGNILEDTKKQEKVIDLFHPPPCRSLLKLHARRSNYIAKIGRQANQKIMVYV